MIISQMSGDKATKYFKKFPGHSTNKSQNFTEYSDSDMLIQIINFVDIRTIKQKEL